LEETRTRIGYVVPQFPGQTHILFVRELRQLERRGIDPDIVSTRPPQAALSVHSWSAEAARRTTYLLPLSVRKLWVASTELLRAGPMRWWRCAGAVVGAEGLSAAGRLRLIVHVIVGAELAAIARRRGWRHVHVHSCANAAHVALFAYLLSGLPYSLTLHSALATFGPDQRAKWRHARFAFVVSEHLLREVRQKLAGDLPTVVEQVPMGVDLDVFSRRVPYQEFAGAGPFRIFSCGRLNPGKGFDDLIRSIALLRNSGVDAQLRVAGADDVGGRCRVSLEQLIADLSLGTHVTLLGGLPEEQVRDELERAHAFALATLDEALGVVFMEAMAMQLPVVATRVGGVPELVRDGVTGHLVPPRDPGALADALGQLAGNPAHAVELGQAGRRDVESTYDSGRSAEMLARHVAC
jgi:glycosyltransferase involved in cell wall biosynthesis